jgi:hypothetical protein
MYTVDPASAANISHTQQPQNSTEHPHKPHTELTQYISQSPSDQLTAQIGAIMNGAC